jgi:pilus assembly protein Flp/PilA
MTGLQALCAKTRQQFWKFCDDDAGASSIEYAIIAAGIAVAVVVAVNAIGTSVKGSFESVSKGF